MATVYINISIFARGKMGETRRLHQTRPKLNVLPKIPAARIAMSRSQKMHANNAMEISVQHLNRITSRNMLKLLLFYILFIIITH